MSQNTHELLEACKSSAKALVDEMEKFKSSSAVNQAVANSLDKVSQTLIKLLEEISPFTDLRFRRFQWIFIGWTALNTILMIVILIVLVRK